MNPSPYLPRLCLAAIVLLASSCTSIEDVKTFGKASKAVSDAALNGYSNFDATRVEAMREAKIILADPQNDLISEDMNRVFAAGTAAGDARMGTLKHLSEYAAALEALATRDPAPELKTAAGDLKSSLTALNLAMSSQGKGSPFSADDIGTISAVVAAIGDVYIQVKREEALRKIIIAADSGVQKVTQLLQSEFPAVGNKLKIDLLAAEKAVISVINKKDSGLDLDGRRALGVLAQSLHDGVVAAPATYAAVAVAAGKMGEAHAKLTAAAAKGNRLSTAETLAAVSDLAARAQQVKDLFDAVRKPAESPKK